MSYGRYIFRHDPFNDICDTEIVEVIAFVNCVRTKDPQGHAVVTSSTEAICINKRDHLMSIPIGKLKRL